MNEHDKEQRRSTAMIDEHFEKIALFGLGKKNKSNPIKTKETWIDGVDVEDYDKHVNTAKSVYSKAKANNHLTQSGLNALEQSNAEDSTPFQWIGSRDFTDGNADTYINEYRSLMNKSAFDIIEDSFEKVAMNASKARYLAKTVGIISPENTTKSIKKSLKPFMSNGNLKSGRQIQRTKEALGSLPNNTFNKIRRVSAKKGHLAEVGAEFAGFKSKRNLNTKNTPSEGAKMLAKKYNEFADLADKKDVISKARAKIKGRKLSFINDSHSARQQAKQLLNTPNSKYNTTQGDAIIGHKVGINNIGGKGYSTTHTHPGHSRISYMNTARRDPNKYERSDAQRLVDGFAKKSDN